MGERNIFTRRRPPLAEPQPLIDSDTPRHTTPPPNPEKGKRRWLPGRWVDRFKQEE